MTAPLPDLRLSPNFTLRELCRSETAARLGIVNVPDLAGVELLRRVCIEILEPVRAHFGRPVLVNSGYRSKALNARIPGSSNTSEHTLCRAVDLEVPGVSNLDVARWIAQGGLRHGFRQLILEAYTPGVPGSGWVHCSLARAGAPPEVMTMQRVRKLGVMRTIYLAGLVA